MSNEEGSSAEPLTEYEVGRKRLWDDLVMLHDQWDQYIDLFGTDPERVKVLNRHARWFFYTVQRSLVRELMLGLSRLTDPPVQGDKTNLVLEGLLEDPALVANPHLAGTLATRISQVRAKAAPVRAHRNKYIAHRDHAVALGRDEELLPRVTRGLLGELVEEMCAIFHDHGSELHGTSYVFELSALGTTSSLMDSLDSADKWRQHERALRRKEFGLPPEDNGTDNVGGGAKPS